MPDKRCDKRIERFRSAILRNPHRRRILELLACRPGMNLRQLGRALGLSVTAVQFHIGRLERHGLVATRTGERRRETLCFKTEDVGLWENPETRPLFGQGTTRELAVYLASNPMASAAEVSEALDVSVYTVRRQIRTLEEHDLVHRLRVDREVLYHAASELEEWVDEIRRRQQDLCAAERASHEASELP